MAGGLALVPVAYSSRGPGLQLPGQVTIVGIIIVTAMVKLLLGSAAAKWALLAPIFADPGGVHVP